MSDCPQCDRTHPRGSEACPARRIGQIVAGKYRLARLVGMGGMGIVYEAVHLSLARPVALKMLRFEHARDAETADRFKREAREAAALGHPGIVQVRDLGEEPDGTLYLEMELLDGESMAERIARGPVDIARAVELTREALAALVVAHAHGIVHRDLKPENLFLARTPAGERVKILDFGLAKLLAESDSGVTRSGVVMGTPVYMSPEQFRDAKRVDVRADVYSMGATLFALLTGRPPVAGATVSEVLFRLAQGEVERHPRALRPEVPAWLDAIVARALAPLPEERFAGADELLRALDAGEKTSPVAFASTLEPTPSPQPSAKSSRAPMAIGGALVVAVATIAGWALTRRHAPATVTVAADLGHSPSVPEGMIAIPGGRFRRGSTPAEIAAAFAFCRTLAGDECRRDLYEREAPAAEATVAPFFLDAREVSNGELGRAGVAPALPAAQVSWSEARDHCARRGARLPSELEWEFAARGLERRRFPWGDAEPRCDGVVFGRVAGGPCKSRGPAPVGSAAADVTPLGVRDLGGNVAEWTADEFAERWDAAAKPGAHAVRGGYFDGLAESTRAAGRSRLNDGERATNIGFRCARSSP
jgi:formylglycine-generating enzyme required for sulfatase activity